MRNPEQLRNDLLRANVEDVRKLAKVSAKTIYRIRQRPSYRPSIQLAEKLSAALDCVKLAPAEISNES